MNEHIKKTVDSLELTAARALAGYPVVDMHAAQIGVLDGIWVDPSTQQPEFFGVVHGLIFKQTLVVPARFGTIDEFRKVVTVPFTEEFVKSAPTGHPGSELAEVEKQQITAHFDCFVPVQRVTDVSEIRPEESIDAPPNQLDLERKQPEDRNQLEREGQSFFNQKGFVTDSMPSVDASENLERTQREARIREDEDEGGQGG
jgi:hypothetical protein